MIILLLMLHPPPTSTLFPTRRSSDLATNRIHGNDRAGLAQAVAFNQRDGKPVVELFQDFDRQRGGAADANAKRSEEHTSELQSHHELVCRLLLEKKHTRTTVPTRSNS